MNIILTGGSKGIGLAIAKELLKDKNNNLIIISRSKNDLENLINEHGAERLKLIDFDLNNLSNYEELFINITKHYQKIDVLINNAGYLINKRFELITTEELMLSYQINVMAPFVLTQKLIPVFSNDAHILNISSIGGIQGSMKFQGLSAYSSSKASLICLTEMLAEEYKNTEMRFNCLALGSVQTKMFETAFPGMKASATPAQMAKFIVNFIINSKGIVGGKIIPLSISNP